MVAQLETSTLSSYPLPYTVEGLLQVFTGKQRNFFTNVIAQALRVAGQGRPVLVVQFLKGGIGQGPGHPVRLGEKLEWVRCNLPCQINTAQVNDAEINAVQQLWNYTQQALLSNQYDLVVLDELSLAVHFGMISEAEILEFLDKRPRHIDIIFTGPEMPQAILDEADQITQIRRSHRP